MQRESKVFSLGRLGPGNRYTGQGSDRISKEVFFRRDSRFLDKKFLSEVERRKVKYAMAAKLYGTIQVVLGGLIYRDIIGGGIEVGEFRYQQY